MQSSLVSIIIPVYNLEKLIRKCVQSVLRQTYENIEVIIVNDGSTDSSLLVLQALVSQDKLIRIIDQENQGVEASRNNGYKIASGRWIAFVDGDDWLPRDAIANLVSAAEEKNADIVIGDRYKVLDGMGWIKKSTSSKQAVQLHLFNYREIGHDEFMQQFYISFFGVNILPVSMCGYLFKSSLIKDARIKYKNIAHNEDACFLMQCLPHARKITTIPNIIYYHRYGGGSGKMTAGLMDSAIKVYRLKKEMIEKYNFEKGRQPVALELKNYLVTYIKNLIIYTDKEKEEIIAITKSEMERPEIREAISIPTWEKFISEALFISIKNRDANKLYSILEKGASKEKAKRNIMMFLNRVLR